MLNVPESSSFLPDQFSFSRFEFIDVRFDSSYMGVQFIKGSGSHGNTFIKVNTANGTATWLTNYLNSYSPKQYTPAGPAMVCYIKKLRITQLDSATKDNNRNKLYNEIELHIETYLKKGDKYYPATKLDTIAKTVVSNQIKFTVLALMAKVLAKKTTLIDIEKVYKRTDYTAEDIAARYAKRFNKPILNDAVKIKGIYRSFKEFVNNTPTIAEYKLLHDQKTITLYTKNDKNEWIPEDKIFGFCDGSICWIKTDYNYNPLIREGHTFEFIEYTEISGRSPSGFFVTGGSPIFNILGSVLVSSAVNSLDNTYYDKKLYQLNMETGETR